MSIPLDELESLQNDYYRQEVNDLIKQQEDKMEEQKQKNYDAYCDSLEPINRKHNKLSSGTRAKRTRKFNNDENFAQALLTGTIVQTKKNTEKYKLIPGQVLTDALPQHARTFAARSKHCNRKINFERLAKINKNTPDLTPSEQR